MNEHVLELPTTGNRAAFVEDTGIQNAFDAERFRSVLLERSAGKSLRPLADVIGISASTLSRIRRGHLPDIETFGRVCEWMYVTPGYFFVDVP